MACHLRRMIAELEDELLYSDIESRFGLKSREGDIFIFDREFFLQSRKLIGKKPFGELVEVTSSSATVELFVNWFRSGLGDPSDAEYLNMIDLTLQLGNEFQFQRCLSGFLSKINEPLSNDCSAAILLRVFGLLCNTPPRDKLTYKNELKRIKSFAFDTSDETTFTEAFDILQKALMPPTPEESWPSNPGNSPVSFETIVAPLLTVSSGRKTFFFIHSKNDGKVNSVWLDPVKQQRYLVDFDSDSIEALYLRYGQFILFKNHYQKEIWRKNLPETEEPAHMVLKNCDKLINRGHNVFATAYERPIGSKIYNLVLDDFEILATFEDEIIDMDYDVNSRIMVVAFRKSIQNHVDIKFFRYEPYILKPMETNFLSDEPCRGVIFSGTSLYYKTGFGHMKAFDVSTVSDTAIEFDIDLKMKAIEDAHLLGGTFFSKNSYGNRFDKEPAKEIGEFGITLKNVYHVHISEICLLPMQFSESKSHAFLQI